MKSGFVEDEVLDERGGGVEKGSVTEFGEVCCQQNKGVL